MKTSTTARAGGWHSWLRPPGANVTRRGLDEHKDSVLGLSRSRRPFWENSGCDLRVFAGCNLLPFHIDIPDGPYLERMGPILHIQISELQIHPTVDGIGVEPLKSIFRGAPYGPCKKSPSLSTRVQGPRTCTHATNPYPSADVGLSRQYFFASCAAPAASAASVHSDSKHCTQYFSSSAFKVNIHSGSPICFPFMPGSQDSRAEISD